MKTAIAGAAGGVALWTAIFPADVVKSRMQIQGGTARQVTLNVLKTDGRYSLVSVLYSFLLGFLGLYRGLTPTLSMS